MKKLSSAIRVLIVDGKGNPSRVSTILKSERDIRVVGTFGALELPSVRKVMPDVVLLENPIGLKPIGLLATNDPPIKTLVISERTEEDYIWKVMRAGVRGYVLTPYVPQEIVPAVRTLHAGYTFFSPTIQSLRELLLLQGL